jgi:UDP-N-acetylmuramoylalanine--D-glutamate ligase
VLGRQTLEVLEPYKTRSKATVIVADETTVPKSWQPKLLGEYNRYNIGVAIETARALGVDDEVIREAVEVFEALAGRTQFVREVNGVKIYNDTNATTPDATVASLQALDPECTKNVVLIMGGSDKGLDMGVLEKEVELRTKHIVMLPGTGSDTVATPHTTHVETLEQAVATALEIAKEGDSVLFSPAFASFGMFKNEYDRGEQFNELVSRL